jgi:hypothetical protein
LSFVLRTSFVSVLVLLRSSDERVCNGSQWFCTNNVKNVLI